MREMTFSNGVKPLVDFGCTPCTFMGDNGLIYDSIEASTLSTFALPSMSLFRRFRCHADIALECSLSERIVENHLVLQ